MNGWQVLLGGSWLVYEALLFYAAGTDLRRKTITRKTTKGLLACSLVLMLVSLPLPAGQILSGKEAVSRVLSCLAGGVLLAGPLFLIDLIRPSSFGAGDIRMSFAACLCLTWRYALFAVMITLLLAAVFVLAAVGVQLTERLRKKKRRPGEGRSKHGIAFGPFLAVGCTAASAALFVPLLRAGT